METGFQTIYKPMLTGCFVRNRDDPPDGFRQYADAVSAARKYRDLVWTTSRSTETGQ